MSDEAERQVVSRVGPLGRTFPETLNITHLC
jgi:hypothetical protein